MTNKEITHYSIEPRDGDFLKEYKLLSSAKNMNKNIGKSLSKNVSSKYRQFFDHAKKSATNVIKFTSKRVIQKIAEATGDLIGDKFADTVF